MYSRHHLTVVSRHDRRKAPYANSSAHSCISRRSPRRVCSGGGDCLLLRGVGAEGRGRVVHFRRGGQRRIWVCYSRCSFRRNQMPGRGACRRTHGLQCTCHCLLQGSVPSSSSSVTVFAGECVWTDSAVCACACASLSLSLSLSLSTSLPDPHSTSTPKPPPPPPHSTSSPPPPPPPGWHKERVHWRRQHVLVLGRRQGYSLLSCLPACKIIICLPVCNFALSSELDRGRRAEACVCCIAST